MRLARVWFSLAHLMRVVAPAAVVAPTLWIMALAADDLEVAKPPPIKERVEAERQRTVAPREEIGKPITVVMSPACRVLFQIDSSGLSALEKEYRADLTGPG
jgi:hypothetical protein